MLDLIDRIKVRAPSMAIKVQASIGRVFNWALGRGIVEASPLAGMKRPVKEQPRERVLEPQELAAVWRGAEAIGWPYGPIVKLLILTGARRSEVDGHRLERDRPGAAALDQAGGAGQEREGAPAAAVAGGGRAAREPARASTARTSYSPTAAARARFSSYPTPRRASTGCAGSRLAAPRPAPDLRVDDGRARRPRGVIAAVLDHSQASLFGVTARYNRFRYQDEQQVALERWGEHVAWLAGGGEATVVKFR